MSLARKIVIRNLMKQRKCIEELIEKGTGGLNTDGNPLIRYMGYIFRENIEYFESQEMGFKVEKILNLKEPSNLVGAPVYLIYPSEYSDSFKRLTEEEIDESNSYSDGSFAKDKLEKYFEDAKMIIDDFFSNSEDSEKEEDEKSFSDIINRLVSELNDDEDDEIEGQEHFDEIIDHEYYGEDNGILADADDYE